MEMDNDKYRPYHIDFDKVLNPHLFNKEFANCFHKHDELGIIRTIYKEPYAFYLTEEDKTYYSDAELRAFKTVQDIAVKKYEAETKLRNK